MYMGLLQDQLSNQNAYEKTMAFFKDCLGDEDDEPLVWFALAETQWKVGRLTPEVKEKALQWIGSNGGIELWEESKSGGAGWEKTLQKLKEKLETPQRKEKKIIKYEVPFMDLWNVNDIYAYQFHEKISEEKGIAGKYMLLQKIGTGEAYITPNPVLRLHILDKIFNKLPSLEDVDGLRVLPVDFPTRVNISENRYNAQGTLIVHSPIWMSAVVTMYKKSEYPAKYLTFIGNKRGPANNVISNHLTRERELSWGGIEGWYKFFELWRGIEYETVEEGVFRYTHPE